MNRTFQMVGIATALALSLAGTALAAPVSSRASSEKQALIDARDELASRAAQTKGAPRAEYELEKKRVDNLIDALQHGKSVSSSEVENAVEESQTSPF